MSINSSNNYFIIEDKYGANVVLNISEGIDESYVFKHLNMTSDKTKIEKIYNDVGTSETIQLGNILKVLYYPKAILLNEYINIKIFQGYVLEIEDVLGNIVYIDCCNNNVYCNRNNYKLKDNDKSVELFKKDEKIEIPEKIIDLKLKLVKLITYVE